jgi:hypothetical protein
MLGSCVSLRPIRSDEVQTSLKAGDTVSIVTRDGRKAEFEIVAVTPEAIVGKDQRVELADIAELQKREISFGKTAGLVGIIVGFVALMALVAVAMAAVLGAAAAGGG